MKIRYINWLISYKIAIVGIQVKQEAVRLYSTLAELEARRDSLRDEEKNRLSPAEERERLLSRVRQDNVEIASMERASAELREHIRQAQLNLQQVNEVGHYNNIHEQSRKGWLGILTVQSFHIW